MPVSRRLAPSKTCAVQVMVVVAVLWHAVELSAVATNASSAVWDVSVSCISIVLVSVVVKVISADS